MGTVSGLTFVIKLVASLMFVLETDSSPGRGFTHQALVLLTRRTKESKMPLDLIIRDAMVIDGSGAPRFGADVGIDGGKIVAVGKVQDAAREVIDAHGAVVSPGFIDGHTHMDAQVFWDALGTCSCWHGVTSVVMGNCGFTLAPVKRDGHELVLSNLECAEGIPASAMEEGIDWTWENFAEYLNAVESR